MVVNPPGGLEAHQQPGPASARGHEHLAVWGLLGLAVLLGCREPSPPASVVPGSSSSRDQASAREPIDHARARELVRALEGEAALAAYKRLLIHDPADARAGLSLAQTGLEFAREQQAADALAQALARDQTHGFGARLGLAALAFARYEALANDDDFQTCELQLRNVLAVDPRDAHALALAVLLYLQRAKLDASAHAPLALTICDEHEPVHAVLASSCAEEAWRRGDPGRARVLLARATTADPEHHGAWLRWGILELDAGNVRNARRYIERAASSPWPSIRTRALANLGVALERLADTPAAVSAYDDALELHERSGHPAPPELLYNLGIAASHIAKDEPELARAQAILERYLAGADASTHADRRLRVLQALAELDSIRAEQQRAQR